MTYVYYQGAYARQWLLKEVDPQNSQWQRDSRKYDELTVLEDTANWGWTVRTPCLFHVR